MASLLILNISGVFDDISYLRLNHNSREKRIPWKITQFLESFLKERTTSQALGICKLENMPTNTGTPQSSPLSLILFLFSASTFPSMSPSSTSAVMGFEDDTNILIWPETTKENCRKLEELHRTCEQ